MPKQFKYSLAAILILLVAVLLAIYWNNNKKFVINDTDVQNSKATLPPDKTTIEKATEIGTGDYSNQDFGISFDYDNNVYTAPKAERDGNGQIQLRMQDATSPTPMPEAPFVLIRKVPGYQNYIDEQVAVLEKNQYVKIINRNKVDGNDAVKYSEDGMGEPITVIIKHPLGFHLHITANFPGTAFDKLIKSIQILK